jgi:hypothetical protein
LPPAAFDAAGPETPAKHPAVIIAAAADTAAADTAAADTAVGGAAVTTAALIGCSTGEDHGVTRMIRA